ncbi:MAG TPA: hypothetical protein ENK50_11520 [Sedimenticola sp.]|nr:hypothetical protein [Sedimenticola sp.]
MNHTAIGAALLAGALVQGCVTSGGGDAYSSGYYAGYEQGKHDKDNKHEMERKMQKKIKNKLSKEEIKALENMKK